MTNKKWPIKKVTKKPCEAPARQYGQGHWGDPGASSMSPREQLVPIIIVNRIIYLFFDHLGVVVVNREKQEDNHQHVNSQVGEDHAPVPLHHLQQFQSKSDLGSV